ncbi:NAD(P)H-hydrate dehydratase [Lentibacillus saliphilus]|uniref:NAD(P)H-hydrate dehydratase n=1 Tax=Lentibacillus saliphilus TaxID=2737028 RepID=UPI001C2FF9A1|nr:NAD(P)H-hydrate dehydratase [Lentibacillus saliphilus]
MFIVTAKEMYDIDHYTMHNIGLESVLMENAGRAVSDQMIQRIAKTDRVFVFVGGGHNGGDGFVIARTLHNLNYHITVLQVVPDDQLVEETRKQKKLFTNCGGYVELANCHTLSDRLAEATVVIDAITGLGIKGQLRSPLDQVVASINQSDAYVIAVDIPSGLPADEGTSSFIAIQADVTIIIGAIKESACLPDTASYYGEWDLVHIGHPPKAFARQQLRWLMDAHQFKQSMPRRTRESHKGDHGRGLMIGGSHNMPGASALAVRAALKSGAGLMTVASSERVTTHIASQCPEAMYIHLPSDQGELVKSDTLLLEGYDAIAVGVGMGRRQETGAFVKSIVETAPCPLIIDADGIYHLNTCLDLVKARKHATIITPHAGEMARLLGIEIDDLLLKPFYYARQLAQTYNMFVVLKGKATIITAPTGEQAVDLTGNPGLAKGGSGDVLTGICLAMIMQKQSIFQALCNACFVHGMSADIQVNQSHSVYDLMATDVIDGIPAVYRTLL